MKGLMIHVGADQSKWYTLGINGPIFADRTFEFVPILEFLYDGTCILRKGEESVAVLHGQETDNKVWTKENRTYSTLDARSKIGKRISDFVPQKYHHMVVHLDPDFDHYTYGDRIETSKGSQISKLRPKDYIFFVSSLAPYNAETYEVRSSHIMRLWQKGRMAKFLIGYFKVRGSYYAWKYLDAEEPSLEDTEEPEKEISVDADEMTQILRNAHTKREEDNYYIVVGDPRDSVVLPRAIQLTEKGFPFRPTEVGREVFGDVGYPRGVKWIYSPERIEYLLNCIKAVRCIA